MLRLQGDLARSVRLFSGLFLYAVGIILTVHANIGASPWEVFHLGLAYRTGLSLGMTSIATSVVLVAFAAALKESVGFGTLSNMVFIGVFMDVIIESGLIPVPQNPFIGVLMLVAGLFTIALATVFYIGAGYGAGPRDSLMVALSRRTGWTPGFCKGCVDAAVLFLGWLLGGKVGVGTVISVLGIGAAVQIVFNATNFKVKDIRQESLAETVRGFRSRL